MQRGGARERLRAEVRWGRARQTKHSIGYDWKGRVVMQVCNTAGSVQRRVKTLCVFFYHNLVSSYGCCDDLTSDCITGQALVAVLSHLTTKADDDAHFSGGAVHLPAASPQAQCPVFPGLLRCI